jgi:hypothetical protein
VLSRPGSRLFKKKTQNIFFPFRSIHCGRRRSEWPPAKKKKKKETVKKIALTGLVTGQPKHNMRKIELDRERVKRRND